MTFRIVGALLLSLLAACGGGGDTPDIQAEKSIVAAVGRINGAPKLAEKEKRFKALSASSAASSPAFVVITADELLNYAEANYPDVFPPGPQSVALSAGGVNYQAVRAYSTENYLGVTVAGEIHGYGPFTRGVLQVLGTLEGFTCEVMPARCTSEALVGPGSYSINRATGHVFLPNLGTGGTLQWLGVAEGTAPVPKPTDVASVQWKSNRTGWGATNSTSTTPPADGRYLASSNTCNRDRGLPTIMTKAVGNTPGVELWPDFSAQGWKLIGDTNPRVVFGQIEYGGYEPATISVVREANNTITLVMDFASDCLFGFGKDGALITLDRAQPLEFAFHSNKSGVGRAPGWGLGPTAAMPTTKKAYRVYDEARGRFLVKFTNMACTDAGSVTVNRHKVIDGQNVTYEYGSDGFGAGWLATPGANDGNPIWQPGAGVTFDPVKYQVKWNQPLCTQ